MHARHLSAARTASLPMTLRTLFDCSVSLPSADTGRPTMSSSASCNWIAKDQFRKTPQLSCFMLEMVQRCSTERRHVKRHLLPSYVKQHQLQLLPAQLQNLARFTNSASVSNQPERQRICNLVTLRVRLRTVRGRGRVMPLPTARPVREPPRSMPRLNPPPCQSGSRPRRRAFGRRDTGSSPESPAQVGAGETPMAPVAFRQRGGSGE
jgi:hypothetical protein